MNSEALAHARLALHHNEAIHPEASAVPALPPLCADENAYMKKMKETYLEAYYDGNAFAEIETRTLIFLSSLQRLKNSHSEQFGKLYQLLN